MGVDATSRTFPTPPTSMVSPLTTFVTSCALARQRQRKGRQDRADTKTLAVIRKQPSAPRAPSAFVESIRRFPSVPSRPLPRGAGSVPTKSGATLSNRDRIARLKSGTTPSTHRRPPPIATRYHQCVPAECAILGFGLPGARNTPFYRAHRAARTCLLQGFVPAREQPPAADAPGDRGRARPGPLRRGGQHEPLAQGPRARHRARPVRGARIVAYHVHATTREAWHGTRSGPAASACRWPFHRRPRLEHRLRTKA